MRRRDAKEPTQRQLRVGEELRHALAWIIERGDFHDPELAKVQVTVTEVRVSPDLRNATAFVTPLGGGDAMPALKLLNHASPFLSRQLAAKLTTKYSPRVNFVEDTSFEFPPV